MTSKKNITNTAALIKKVSRSLDISKEEAKAAIESVFDNVFEELVKGRIVTITRYGKFYLDYATADERIPKNLVGHATNFSPEKIKPRAYVRWKSSRKREIVFNEEIGLERDEPPSLSI